MTQQWTPGDIALVNDASTNDGWLPAICVSPGVVGQAHWRIHKGEVWGSVTEVRPLVVLDPDGPEVNRLVVALGTANRGTVDQMRAALRSLVTPPRPDEPTGLGAVIEDTGGRQWVRAFQDDDQPWVADFHASRKYDDLDAVRVLSEGVTP